MARKNLFSTEPPVIAKDTVTPKPFARPNSMSNPLSLMRDELRSMVREVRADLIDGSAYTDRIPGADPELDKLIESIKQHGQLVPALLRPSPNAPKRFEIVYGRRRLAAVRELDIPLRAVIQELDDTDALIAQGAENNERLDPSFIEKALFAAQLAQSGSYTQEQIAEIVCTTQPTVSLMIRIVKVLGPELIHEIGPCHDLGRRPWAALVDLVSKVSVKGDIASRVTIKAETDQERFDSLVAQVEVLSQNITSEGGEKGSEIASGEPKATEAPSSEPGSNGWRRKFSLGAPGLGPVVFERNTKALGIKFNRSEETSDFDRWLEGNVEEVLETIKAKWQEAQISAQND